MTDPIDDPRPIAADAVRTLAERPGAPAVGLTWVPAPVLEAMFHGAASGPAEALGALAREVRLDLAFIPAEEPWARAAVAELAAAGALPLWAVAGPLGRVAQSRGWMQALRDTAAAPAELAYALSEALHDALDAVRAGAAAGAGAIVVADDLAGDSGPLVSPDYVLEALLPLYRRLAVESREAGLPAVFHSDGDTRVLLPALAKAGFSAVHPGGLVDDVLEAYRALAAAQGLVVLGGLNASRLMTGATDSGLAAAEFAAKGGVIVTDDGSIARPEPLAAFVTAARAIRAAR